MSEINPVNQRIATSEVQSAITEKATSKSSNILSNSKLLTAAMSVLPKIATDLAKAKSDLSESQLSKVKTNSATVNKLLFAGAVGSAAIASSIGVASVGTLAVIASPVLVPLAILACLCKVLSNHIGKMEIGKSDKKQDISTVFAQKFPGTEGLNESQMRNISKADDLLNSIAENTKGLDKINSNMNATMKAAIPTAATAIYVSGDKIQTATNPSAWKDTEKKLNDIKSELKLDPTVKQDSISLSSEASVQFSKKYGGEPGMIYSKGVNQCTEELNKSPTGSILNKDNNKPAIHETYVRLQTMEIALGGPRKMAIGIQDRKSYDQLDKMYQEVRTARVELMKEFGVEVELGKSYDW